jgi:hypothetical protein
METAAPPLSSSHPTLQRYPQVGDIITLRIFPRHAYKTPGKEGEHVSAKWNIPISRSRPLRAPTSLQSNVKILTYNPIAITPPSPYPTDIDLQHATHNNIPQVTGHSPPDPTSLNSICTELICTNRPGNTNTQPKHTTTHRQQPPTRSPLRSITTQTETVSTFEYPTPCTYPLVGKHKSTTYLCHRYFNISNTTMYNNHKLLATYLIIRGTEALLGTPSSPHRHDPTPPNPVQHRENNRPPLSNKRQYPTKSSPS